MIDAVIGLTTNLRAFTERAHAALREENALVPFVSDPITSEPITFLVCRILSGHERLSVIFAIARSIKLRILGTAFVASLL
jgi:hypothetical protein